jgi:hypothetical protein
MALVVFFAYGVWKEDIHMCMQYSLAFTIGYVFVREWCLYYVHACAVVYLIYLNMNYEL